MSFVTRRALSTLIPPKIASTSGLGAAKDAARMQRVVSFYEKLPRGQAPDLAKKGFWGNYQKKHFGEKPTAKPIIHLITILVGFGYGYHYFSHFRHHKNNAH